jgi:hypothetical protein
VKVPIFVVSTGAAVVLAVPAAQAALRNAAPVGKAADRHAPHAAGSHRSKAHHAIPIAAKSKKGSSRTVPRPSTGPIYIYIPAPPIGTVAPAAPDPNECQDTGNNCTPQQLCDFWGENCPAPPVDTTAVDGSTTDPSIGEGTAQ